MRKLVQRPGSVIVLIIIGLTGCVSSNQPYSGNAESRTRLAHETAAFIRDKKIPFKSKDAEFYGNATEQVYLLNSQERVKLHAKKSLKNTVAVIQHKQANGKSDFYVIEQRITPRQITFVLRKDAKILESLPIALPAAPSPGGSCKTYCETIDAYNKARLQALQVEANKTCSTKLIGLPICQCVNGFGTVVGSAFYAIYPTSLSCGILVSFSYRESQFWTLKSPSPFLDQAFNAAIKKEAKLYTF